MGSLGFGDGTLTLQKNPWNKLLLQLPAQTSIALKTPPHPPLSLA